MGTDFSKVSFYKSINDAKLLENIKLPQVALVGRSNVGKSSLINALFNQKELARTSKKPGKTIHANLFTIDQKFYIVDLPGYGYAQLDKKVAANCGRLINHYLDSADKLKTLFLLVDGRRFLTSSDLEIFDLANQLNIEVFLVFTKLDKLKEKEINQLQEEAEEFLEEKGLAKQNYLMVSSSKKTNIYKLRKHIIKTFH